MKGVIVQIGNPKSIVLFNNGKISAISTPAEAHVGMVVTVNLNSRIKVIAVSMVVVLILLAGIGIGVAVSKGGAKSQSHGQYGDKGQHIERAEENAHDNSGYSFQKGKMENAVEQNGD